MLTSDEAAEKTLSILLELIKSGRYTNQGNTPIKDIVEEATQIKQFLEQLYSRAT